MAHLAQAQLLSVLGFGRDLYGQSAALGLDTCTIAGVTALGPAEACSVTLVTTLESPVAEPDLGTFQCLLQRDVESGFDVCATRFRAVLARWCLLLRKAAAESPSAHELRENVTQIDSSETASKWIALEAAATKHILHAAALVVFPSGLGRADSLVSGLNRLEALLGRSITRIAIGMILAREFAVSALDFSIGSILGDSENSVWVLGHRCLSVKGEPSTS